MSHLPPSPAEAHDGPWYRKAFQAGYLDLYAHRDEADAARAVEFIARRASIGPSARLLDLCCGSGRHLALLAPRVGRAVGLDLSRVLLGEARQYGAARAEDAPGRRPTGLVEGDMRSLPFREGLFNVVLNLFTSLGYFESDRENHRVIEEVARVLAPGGLFVLDHINREHLESSMRAASERRLASGALVVERRTFDPRASRVRKRVEWMEGGRGVAEWIESVRVYERRELTALLAEAGLREVGAFGDFDESPLTPGSPRMILVARRAERSSSS